MDHLCSTHSHCVHHYCGGPASSIQSFFGPRMVFSIWWVYHEWWELHDAAHEGWRFHQNSLRTKKVSLFPEKINPRIGKLCRWRIGKLRYIEWRRPLYSRGAWPWTPFWRMLENYVWWRMCKVRIRCWGGFWEPDPGNWPSFFQVVVWMYQQRRWIWGPGSRIVVGSRNASPWPHCHGRLRAHHQSS